MKEECDGRCGAFNECEGKIREVDVYSKNKIRKWSTNNYCEKAIKDTRDMGYVVEIKIET